MSTYIKTTADGRKVEVIGSAIFLAGKQEADSLVPVAQHPNQAAILQAVPDATHMAGRLPLTAEEAVIAHNAMEKARIEYETSAVGIAERIRKTQRTAIANRD